MYEANNRQILVKWSTEVEWMEEMLLLEEEDILAILE